MTSATSPTVETPPRPASSPTPVPGGRPDAPRSPQLRSLRTLLVRLSVFGLINLALFLALEYRLARIPNSYARKQALLTAQAPDLQVLVLGSSHAYYGINPEQLGARAFNAAYIAQDHYYDTRIALQHLDRMPNLRLVIVPVSYHTLETNLCDTGEYWRAFFYRRFNAIPRFDNAKRFDPRNASLLLLYRNKEVFRFLTQGFDVNLCPTLRSDGFAPSDDFSPITTAAGEDRMALHHDEMRSHRLPQNVAFLEQLFSALKRRNIRIAMVSIPVHHTYSDNIDPKRYDRMQAAIRDLQTRYGAEYFDYMFDPRFELADYANTDHLDAAGADKLSKILRGDVVRPPFPQP